MFFEDPKAFGMQPRKAVTLFGMSGVGKTRAASLLREERWFHYSVDYRIGSRYMNERVEDNLKQEAMRSPLLRTLLLSDSICVRSKLTFNNLAPLSTYLGKPGDPSRGGLPFEEYVARQRQHRTAEIAATLDAAPFIERAKALYGYDHFLCDASGSLCEVVDPDDPADPVLTVLAEKTLLLFIRGDEAHEDALAARFERDPKPMYYHESFLRHAWLSFLEETGAASEREVDPDAFMRWSFRKALSRRAPLYEGMAQHWGYAVTPEEIGAVRDEGDFVALIEQAIARRDPAAPKLFLAPSPAAQ